VSKELQDIIAAYRQQKNEMPTVLATVVSTAGSVYRRTGARMLIRKDDRPIGLISGGCLENDIRYRAQSVMKQGKPVIATYDAVSNEELRWGLGLGCNGRVDVLLEQLNEHSPCNPLTFIEQCFKQREPAVVATIIQTDDADVALLGARLMRCATGKMVHNLSGNLSSNLSGNLSSNLSGNPSSVILTQLTKVVEEALPMASNQHKQCALQNGMTILIESIYPPAPLIIFGSGQDVVPVIAFAKAIGREVTVISQQPYDLMSERFPLADNIMEVAADSPLKGVDLSANTAAIVMTHNYFDDRECLKKLISSEVSYIGSLGPRYRTESLLKDLKEHGMKFTDQQLNRLYTPVGLDIGADTPEEIAISIISEIIATKANRLGGSLKKRSHPIHSRVQSAHV